MPSLLDTAYAKALESLRCKLPTDRVGAWKAVAPLVPEVGAEIRSHLRFLAQMVRVSNPEHRKQLKPFAKPKKPLAGLCKACHEPLPHKDKGSLRKHGWYANLVKVRKNRWVKYPEKQDRRAQTGLARSTVLAARHNRRIAALRLFDPLRTDHVLRTQGREGVLALWSTLPNRKQRRLLKAVPPPAKRRFKGEYLVRAGLRAERPAKGRS